MKSLIFVYNVNSGKANSYLDVIHKIFKPSTYACDLCKLTYGTFSERSEWKKFRENLDVETEFLHKDEFQKEYASKFGYKFEFPIVLFKEDRGMEVLVSKEELAALEGPAQLIDLLDERLK